MNCSHVNSALLEGRLRSAEEEAHIAACPACKALLAGLSAPSRPVSVPTPSVPSAAALNAGVRQQQLREWTVAGAALAAAALLVVGLWPAPSAPLAEPLLATVPEQATPEENVAADRGDTAAPLPSDASTGHAGLLALLDGLDQLERPVDPLPGDELMSLLDPYANRSTPVYDPFDFNQGDL